MNRLAVDALGFGFVLWLIGFALGMVFFLFIPVQYIGLPILAIMIPVTLFVLWKRFAGQQLTKTHIAAVAVTWMLIAVVLDYLILVKGFNVQNYYDADVLAYYALTFVMPIAVGLKYGKVKG